MVNHSILVAHEVIAHAHKRTQCHYDSDFHPEWVSDVGNQISSEIESLKIDVRFLPSYLEELLEDALTEWFTSDNIEALMCDLETERFEREHWIP